MTYTALATPSAKYMVIYGVKYGVITKHMVIYGVIYGVITKYMVIYHIWGHIFAVLANPWYG